MKQSSKPVLVNLSYSWTGTNKHFLSTHFYHLVWKNVHAHLFNQLFQIYPHNIHHTFNFGVNANTFPYPIHNTQPIRNLYKHLLGNNIHRIHYFSWALPLPTWSHHQLLYKHLSQLPHWSSGLQSYLQTSTTYFLYNSQYDSFKI